MRKKLLTVAMAAIMVVSSAFSAFAAIDTSALKTGFSGGTWGDDSGVVTLDNGDDVKLSFHTTTSYTDSSTSLKFNYDTIGLEIRPDGAAGWMNVRADMFSWTGGTSADNDGFWGWDNEHLYKIRQQQYNHQKPCPIPHRLR